MPDYPIRTFTLHHRIAGTLQFSVPVQNPEDVEVYARRVLADLPIVEQFTLANTLVKQANVMWSGYAMWIGDPVEARLKLRQDPEVRAWMEAGR